MLRPSVCREKKSSSYTVVSSSCASISAHRVNNPTPNPEIEKSGADGVCFFVLRLLTCTIYLEELQLLRAGSSEGDETLRRAPTPHPHLLLCAVLATHTPGTRETRKTEHIVRGPGAHLYHHRPASGGTHSINQPREREGYEPRDAFYLFQQRHRQDSLQRHTPPRGQASTRA